MTLKNALIALVAIGSCGIAGAAFAASSGLSGPSILAPATIANADGSATLTVQLADNGVIPAGQFELTVKGVGSISGYLTVKRDDEGDDEGLQIYHIRTDSLQPLIPPAGGSYSMVRLDLEGEIASGQGGGEATARIYPPKAQGEEGESRCSAPEKEGPHVLICADHVVVAHIVQEPPSKAGVILAARKVMAAIMKDDLNAYVQMMLPEIRDQIASQLPQSQPASAGPRVVSYRLLGPPQISFQYGMYIALQLIQARLRMPDESTRISNGVFSFAYQNGTWWVVEGYTDMNKAP
jgi:hypothetical protein